MQVALERRDVAPDVLRLKRGEDHVDDDRDDGGFEYITGEGPEHSIVDTLDGQHETVGADARAALVVGQTPVERYAALTMLTRQD